jgi:hypothetical protein
MFRIRTSIAGLMACVFFIAMAIASLLNPSPLWASCLFMFAVALMSAAILGVCAGRQKTRMTWAGVAIFGWVHAESPRGYDGFAADRSFAGNNRLRFLGRCARKALVFSPLYLKSIMLTRRDNELCFLRFQHPAENRYLARTCMGSVHGRPLLRVS